MVSTRAGQPISASNFLAREFYPALEAAKLPRVVFHSLRRTASTILASSNTPSGTVHRILGHASFATTMKLTLEVQGPLLAQGAVIFDGSLASSSGTWQIEGAKVQIATNQPIATPELSVPEPGTFALLLLGIGALMGRRRRQPTAPGSRSA